MRDSIFFLDEGIFTLAAAAVEHGFSISLFIHVRDSR